MLSRSLAQALQAAGLNWRPASGDAFVIVREGFEGDVFIVSDMTIESHEFETGTILGFNGTTEWALDSIALEGTLWLPHEHQLRELLAGTFRSLTRTEGGFRVNAVLLGEPVSAEAVEAADAYGQVLLRLVSASA